MKDKKIILASVVLILGLVLIVYWERTREKPISWEPTFINVEKNPYDTYISYKLLEDAFPEGKVSVSRSTIYEEMLLENHIPDSLKTNPKAYLFVNRSFALDELDLGYLLDFVDKGNYLFVSAEYFSPLFLDTLNLATSTSFIAGDELIRMRDVPKRVYKLKNIYNNFSIGFKTDSLSKTRITQKLEPLAVSEGGNIVFARLKYGKGYIYLHTNPVAFTNYEMVKLHQYDYAFRCLSYLPRNSSVLWDEYQTQGAEYEKDMLREIWRSPALKWAYTLALIGIALFMLFRSKRIQRIIPTLKPPRNSSLEFLSTISNLYYAKRDYKAIAEKRYFYFLDKIRNNYYLSTEVIDSEFISALSLKSGVEASLLENLFYKYNKMNNSSYNISNNEFIELNDMLEEFYKKSNLTKTN